MQVEYVSANPTGPLHVGHGRGAAYGSVVANLLSAAGFAVHREYYVNDAGRQMDILAASVWLRYLEECGEVLRFPNNGYRGEYVREIATELLNQVGERFRHPAGVVLADLPLDEHEGGDKEIYIDAMVSRAKTLLGAEGYREVFDAGLNSILDDIQQDLGEFGVEYDEWFSERVRENGQMTYFASDIAYHMNKLERGYDRVINIWGADHHGYIPRVKASLQALGADPTKLD
ncbi:MAG: arginyl-tRNA synthetase, partial [Proteobacteria bacterium]|nr:arginyl-tRNA synthetase [Pseudomonadota bacterium]